MPGADKERALEVAEAILSELEDVSMSLGVVTDCESSLQGLIQEADLLMYQAKQDGGGKYKSA